VRKKSIIFCTGTVETEEGARKRRQEGRLRSLSLLINN
jgi:hypothetical protein